MKFQEFLETVQVGQATALSVAKDNEKGLKVTCEMRQMQPEAPKQPVRAESAARAHTFLTPESLGEYLKKYGGDDTTIYADPDALRISAVLKETATDGKETLIMQTTVHPSAEPWKEIAGQTVELSAFLDVVLLNRRAVTDPQPAALVMMLSQIKASKKVEAMRGRGTEHTNGVMVEMKLQGTNDVGYVDLPDRMTIAVPLFHGTPAMKIELDLTVDVTMPNDVPKVYVRVSGTQWREAELAAFEAMSKKVRDIAGKGLALVGRPAEREWKYLASMTTSIDGSLTRTDGSGQLR
jgi:hypothetical protein